MEKIILRQAIRDFELAQAAKLKPYQHIPLVPNDVVNSIVERAASTLKNRKRCSWCHFLFPSECILDEGPDQLCFGCKTCARKGAPMTAQDWKQLLQDQDSDNSVS